MSDRSGRTFEEYRQLYWDGQNRIAELKGLVSDLECDVHFWKTRAEKPQQHVVELEATIERVEALIPTWDKRISNLCTVEKIDLLLMVDELRTELESPAD